MRLKSGLELREVGGQTLLVSMELEPGDPGFMVVFNGSGAYLCRLLAQGTDVPQMEAALADHYDVTQDTARECVAAFVSKMGEADLLAD